MAEYLVELYVSREDSAAVESGAQRARAAADELTEEGAPVRYLRAIFVPEDETCFFLYEALSAEAVRDAARRAGLLSGRVTEALGALKGDEA
jgi:Nickel responsive protein SCO4226-like